MAQLLTPSKPLKSQENVVGLYLGSFLFSFAVGILFLALPFIVINLGGSDKEVGFCFGINIVAYMIACCLAGFVLDQFSPKRTLQLSSAGMALATAGICLTVLLNAKRLLPFSPILAVIGFLTLVGLVQSFFWPQIMGWVSTGYEGPHLSRRLGIYNLSWSLAMVVSPLIGGYLIEINYTWPLIVTIALFLLVPCFVGIVSCPYKTSPVTKKSTPENLADDLLHPSLPRFRWMSRIALATSALAVALIRSQLALLFTENLGFSASHFGYAVMFMSLAILIVFFITSKTHLWHHKLSPFLATQVFMMLGMLFILYSVTIWGFYAATAMVGLGFGFTYYSHQYYGVSGGKRRSGRMAIHEITIAIGFAIGSILGGLIGEHFGRYVPYWFGFSVIAGSLAIQLAVWLLLKPQEPKTPIRN